MTVIERDVHDTYVAVFDKTVKTSVTEHSNGSIEYEVEADLGRVTFVVGGTCDTAEELRENMEQTRKICVDEQTRLGS